MKIALCDDEKAIREDIKSMSVSFFNNKNIPCSIDTFDSFQSFYIKNSDYDMVFLDYSMPGEEDGIEFAKRLRAVNKGILIIFLTAFPEHVFESFSLNTFRYLVKPINEKQLYEALDSFIEIYKTNKKTLVTFAEKNYVLDSDDVMYIEAAKRYTVVRTTGNTFCSNKGISSYDAEINNPHFFRTHRSYIVNMKYISSFERKMITMTNGERVPVSPKRYEEFEKNYFSYLKYKS